MKTRNLLWLPVVLLMAACGDEEEGSVVSSMPIQFSAEISASRVTGDSWEIGDRIGISMSGAETKTNLPYVTVQTDGKFSAEGEELRFPDVPGDVVFHAYYPYSETLNGNMLTFNADGKTDVLWAEKSVSCAVGGKIGVRRRTDSCCGVTGVFSCLKQGAGQNDRLCGGCGSGIGRRKLQSGYTEYNGRYGGRSR